jgi:hypothetical protein
MNKTLANGMTRWAMMYQIKLECDTNSACYKMTDDELIACYNKIFGITAQKDLTTAD